MPGLMAGWLASLLVLAEGKLFGRCFRPGQAMFDVASRKLVPNMGSLTINGYSSHIWEDFPYP